MPISARYAVALTLLCAGSGACKSKEPPPAPSVSAPPVPAPAAAPVVEEPQAAAEGIFRGRCSVCHGPTGHGDGPGGAVLTPKPRVFTDATWQASVKDEQLREIIVKGGAAVGKSAGMPPNPDLEPKPDVVGELVKLIRGFKS